MIKQKNMEDEMRLEHDGIRQMEQGVKSGKEFAVRDSSGNVYCIFPAKFGNAMLYYTVRLDERKMMIHGFSDIRNPKCIAVTKDGRAYFMSDVCKADLTDTIFVSWKEAEEQAAGRIKARVQQLAENNTEIGGRESMDLARRLILNGKAETAREEMANALMPDITVEVVLNDLCGFQSLEEYAEYKFNERKIAEWNGALRFVKRPDIVTEEWERRLAKGLCSVPDAKTVMVTFAANGKETTLRTPMDTLASALEQKQRFSSYMFATGESKATAAIKSIGCAPFGGEKALTAKYIAKVAYKRHVVYDAEPGSAACKRFDL